MKKLKSLVIVTVLLFITSVASACGGTNEAEIIEEFLTCWLQNSTANAELQHLMMEGATVIGIGADEMSDEEKVLREENAESFDKLFEETYGKYMTDDAIEVFKTKQYSVCSMLFLDGASWEIDTIDVQEEADSYRFNVEIIVDGNESQRMVVQGRILMEDGVICELSNM